MTDVKRIRNFSIIAHIDHGKSTLADRLLEYTGTVAKREMKDRLLDTLELEQEKGITIKLQTARMHYNYEGDRVEQGEYILNLIDTPGHVDFSFEVSRSVAASEGALLLVDATQGIQAQTLSTMYKALEYDLTIIPVINKVDLPSAEVENAKLEIMEAFGFKEEEIVLASGKTGVGVKEILDAIVERVQPPKIVNTDLTRGLVFDSFYHDFKGVVALVKLVEGEINDREKLYFLGSETEVTPVDIGYLKPAMQAQSKLVAGEVGYIATGLKDIRQVHVGDTITIWKPNKSHLQVTHLAGYQQPKPMVFASLYPVEANDFADFQVALEKLALNDAALTYQRENSQALGTGYVCGFLGLLHLEVIQERLDREFNIDLISTSPTVEFKILLATKDLSKVPNVNIAHIDNDGLLTLRTAAEFPDPSLVKEIKEPWVKLEIFTPEEFVGEVMELCQDNRGIYKSLSYLGQGNAITKRHVVLTYEIPTLEIMVNFFDKLKSISHGYASMDYTFLDYRVSDIVRVSILINFEEAEALSFLVHKDNAIRRGKAMVEKLAELIPRQQFKVPIQASIWGKVIARSDIQAYKKDVTAKLYGGDETRKKKLLEKQKKGKKKMKEIGKVTIPKEVFLAALRT